jgi:hypothetical protein
VSKPSVESVLKVIRAKARLVELGRTFSVTVPAAANVEEQVATLVRSPDVRFRDLLGVLSRDELRSACRAHGLEANARARTVLATQLLKAQGDQNVPATASHFMPKKGQREVPETGDVVRVRHRQYLVESVLPPPDVGHATRVGLVCLDDDNQGRRLEVLWELELGAQILNPEAHLPEKIARLDPPRFFAAYLHALKWNSVTATDAKLFQAPFRAGIQLLNHQLTPLKKALELPRANLFIADDVGLGKTIEAGLVLQELILRQRVDFVLIVAPAAVALQWRDEMQKRFGLQFEVYSRTFMNRRRQERGFGVNPWSTHNRFIISYQTLRRPEYRDPLLQHVGERARKSLLILDEAHTVAPASASKYAIDSRTTDMARDLAPRFENRLFLSATPHNGHSNSFSALLEILDPQRFTRGVPVTTGGRDPRARLDPVMVRRLKSDLRELGVKGYPERRVIQVELRHASDTWTARYATDEGPAGPPQSLGHGSDAELTLARMLGEYTQLVRPKKGRGKLVFVNLQKRLMSSVESFCRTLSLHAESAGRLVGQLDDVAPPAAPEGDGDEYGLSDDEAEGLLAREVAEASQSVKTPAGRARELLDGMLKLARNHSAAPDARVLALVEWMSRNQCPGVRIGGAEGLPAAKRRWSDRRVIVFTEYGDTKRYLVQLLRAAVEGTDDADLRIMQFHGGMSDEQREEVQTAFNGPPDRYPVRVLVCTDAAREGVNLQGHCADLFHFDVPWNPSRMEQRNGRIDRTLQQAPEVRCHYFTFPQRPEDAVLVTIVRKIRRIHRELGSLGDVVMERITRALDDGIDERSALVVEHADDLDGKQDIARDELECQRELAKLRQEADDVGRILEASRRVAEFDPRLLRDALDVGFELAQAGRLTPIETVADTFSLPELPDSWTQTLDSVRPPRPRTESFWDWRRRPPVPVVFQPPERMTTEVAHLHLQHPLVQRVLSRFLAQGTSAHDLTRVTAVVTPNESTVRVLAFGRLSLFGPGATRLHDQLVSVAAPWFDAGGPKHLKPFADERADRRALDRLEDALREAPTLDRLSPKAQQRLLTAAPGDFKTLWAAIREEADARAQDARQKLLARGRAEAEALKKILQDQRHAIETTIKRSSQQLIMFSDAEKDERRQLEQDRAHMERRLLTIEEELTREPAQIEELYRIVLMRLEPVGLIYLWPETRA